MKNPRSLRLLVPILGVLSVAGAAIFNAGFVGQTLASWTDRVFGSSTFGVNAASLQGYSQALGGGFQINRLISSDAWRVRLRRELPRVLGQRRMPATGFTKFESDGLLGIVATELESAVCASYLSSSGTCTDYGSTPPAVHSVAVARNLRTRTGDFLGVTRFFSATGETFEATASCVPGTAPTASAVQSTSGQMYLGDTTSNPIAVPVAPPGTGTQSQSSKESSAKPNPSRNSPLAKKKPRTPRPWPRTPTTPLANPTSIAMVKTLARTRTGHLRPYDHTDGTECRTRPGAGSGRPHHAGPGERCCAVHDGRRRRQRPRHRHRP